MRHDSLSDALIIIKNADHVGKNSAVVPASRLIGDVLKQLTEKGYLNNYEYEDNGKGGVFNISLNGRINGVALIRGKFDQEHLLTLLKANKTFKTEKSGKHKLSTDRKSVV